MNRELIDIYIDKIKNIERYSELKKSITKEKSLLFFGSEKVKKELTNRFNVIDVKINEFDLIDDVIREEYINLNVTSLVMANNNIDYKKDDKRKITLFIRKLKNYGIDIIFVNTEKSDLFNEFYIWGNKLISCLEDDVKKKLDLELVFKKQFKFGSSSNYRDIVDFNIGNIIEKNIKTIDMDLAIIFAGKTKIDMLKFCHFLDQQTKKNGYIVVLDNDFKDKSIFKKFNIIDRINYTKEENVVEFYYDSNDVSFDSLLTDGLQLSKELNKSIRFDNCSSYFANLINDDICIVKEDNFDGVSEYFLKNEMSLAIKWKSNEYRSYLNEHGKRNLELEEKKSDQLKVISSLSDTLNFRKMNFFVKRWNKNKSENDKIEINAIVNKIKKAKFNANNNEINYITKTFDTLIQELERCNFEKFLFLHEDYNGSDEYAEFCEKLEVFLDLLLNHKNQLIHVISQIQKVEYENNLLENYNKKIKNSKAYKFNKKFLR